jgi:hypothetical protein
MLMSLSESFAKVNCHQNFLICHFKVNSNLLIHHEIQSFNIIVDQNMFILYIIDAVPHLI